MKVTLDVVVDAIYASEYTDKEGNTRLAYNLEIRNPEFTSRYNRLYSMGIDKDCWKRLDLQNSGSNYAGQECRITCGLSQFQGSFSLFAVDIELTE